MDLINVVAADCLVLLTKSVVMGPVATRVTGVLPRVVAVLRAKYVERIVVLLVTTVVTDNVVQIVKVVIKTDVYQVVTV
jgi:hypothetical protein